MSKTPDRFPGEREDEGLLLTDEGVSPTQEGETRYRAGSFQMRDSAGIFNPRDGGGGGYVANRLGQLLFSLDASTFVPANPVVDDIGDIVTDDTYEMVVEITP